MTFEIVLFSCCCSVAKSCLSLCDPMDCSIPASSVLYYLLQFAQIYIHWVGDAIYPSHPLLPPSPLPSIFPSIRVFSNESALHIRWPKYWSFTFSTSPSNEYSGLNSFRIDLKCNIEKKKKNKLRSWHPVPSLHCKLKGKKWKQWQILFP